MKFLFFIITLAFSSFFIANKSVNALGERLNSICKPKDSDNADIKFDYVCSVLANYSDSIGPIYTTSQMPLNESAVNIETNPVGPGGRGGVIIEKDGTSDHIIVLDGTGNKTHRDYVAISGSKEVVPPNVTLLGDVGKSELNISTKGFDANNPSGNAVFIGDGNNIKVNVSGKDGSNGRNIPEVLAMSVLKGELLGVSEYTKKLVDKLLPQLSDKEVKDPSLTKEELSSEISGISKCEGDLINGDSTDLAGVFKVSTKRARIATAERAICKRLTNEELTAQVMCVRKEQTETELSCEYDSVIKPIHIFKRKSEVIQSELTCSEPIADGRWNVKCSRDYSTVLASAMKPYYISLKPSEDIKNAMAVPVYDKNIPIGSNTCGKLQLKYNSVYYDYDDFFDSPMNDFYGKKIIESGVSDGCGYGFSQTPYINKFDYLRATGAYVKKIELKDGFPGTKKEYDTITKNGNPLHGQTDSNYGVGLSKLSYWAFHEGNTDTKIKRSIFDLKNSSNEYLNNTLPSNVTELKHDSRTIQSLKEIGIDEPNIEDGLIGYKDIKVTIDESGHSIKSAIKEFLCPGVVYDSSCNGLSSISVNSNFPKDQHISDSNKTVTPTYDGSGVFNIEAGNVLDFKFKRKVSYKFVGMASGYILKRTEENSNISPLRVIKESKFKKRMMFIPGSRYLELNKKFTLCEEYDINNNSDALISSNVAEPYNFILPVPYRGIAVNTFDTFLHFPEHTEGVWDWGQQFNESRYNTTFFYGRSDYQYQKKYALKDVGFGGWEFKGMSVDNRNKIYPTIDNKYYQTNQIGLLGNSFVINRSNSMICRQNSAGQPNVISIENSYNSYEKKVFDYFSNFGSVLITSNDDTINVYYSPFKIGKKDTDKVIISQTIDPNMYIPRVDIGPTKLESDIENEQNFGFHDQTLGLGNGQTSVVDANNILNVINEKFYNSKLLEVDSNVMGDIGFVSDKIKNFNGSLKIDVNKSIKDLYLIPRVYNYAGSSTGHINYLKGGSIDISGGAKINEQKVLFTAKDDVFKKELRFLKILKGFSLNVNNETKFPEVFKENIKSQLYYSGYAIQTGIKPIINSNNIDVKCYRNKKFNYPSKLVSKIFRKSGDNLNFTNSDQSSLYENENDLSFFDNNFANPSVGPASSNLIEPNYLMQDKNSFYMQLISNYKSYEKNLRKDAFKYPYINANDFFNMTPAESNNEFSPLSNGLDNVLNKTDAELSLKIYDRISSKERNYKYFYAFPWSSRISPNKLQGLGIGDRILNDNNYSEINRYLPNKVIEKKSTLGECSLQMTEYNCKAEPHCLWNQSLNKCEVNSELDKYNDIYYSGHFLPFLRTDSKIYAPGETNVFYQKYIELSIFDKLENPTTFNYPAYLGITFKPSFTKIINMSNNFCKAVKSTCITNNDNMLTDEDISFEKCIDKEPGNISIMKHNYYATSCVDPASPINYISNSVSFFNGIDYSKGVNIFGAVRSENPEDLTNTVDNLDKTFTKKDFSFVDISGYAKDFNDIGNSLDYGCDVFNNDSPIEGAYKYYQDSKSNLKLNLDNDNYYVRFQFNLPNGYTEDSLGGLYYGSLIPKGFVINDDKIIHLDKIKTGYQSTDLGDLNAQREKNALYNYDKYKIIQFGKNDLYYENLTYKIFHFDAGHDLVKVGDASKSLLNNTNQLKLITIRKLLSDSKEIYDRNGDKSSLYQSNEISSHIIESSPELLAAYFLHSSVSAKKVSDNDPKILVGNYLSGEQNSQKPIWRPSEQQNALFITDSAPYTDLFNSVFSTSSGFHLRFDQRSIINSKGFTLNSINVSKVDGISKSDQPLIINPFILSFDKDSLIERNGNRLKLAWELDEHSMHSYVISANEADGSSIRNQTQGTDLSAIPGTGLVVSFADKIFGSDHDPVNVAKASDPALNILRSEGLSRREIWEKKINPSFRSSSVGVDCGAYSATSTTTGAEISSLKQICINNSNACEWSDTNNSCNAKSNIDSFGDFTSAQNSPFVAASVNPKYDFDSSSDFFMFSEAICSENRKTFLSFNAGGGSFYSYKIGEISPFLDSCVKSAFYSKNIKKGFFTERSTVDSLDNNGIDNNVYWLHSKIDSSNLDESLKINTDGFNNKPSCPVGSKEVSAMFVSVVPKKTISFSPPSWKTNILVDGDKKEARSVVIEPVKSSGGEYTCPTLMTFYKFKEPSDTGDCSSPSSNCYKYANGELNATLFPVVMKYSNIYTSNSFCFDDKGRQIEDRRKDGFVYNDYIEKCGGLTTQNECSSVTSCSWNSGKCTSTVSSEWVTEDNFRFEKAEYCSNDKIYKPSYVVNSSGWVVNDGKYINAISNSSADYNIYSGYYVDSTTGFNNQFDGNDNSNKICKNIYINKNGDGTQEENPPTNYLSNYLILNPRDSSVINRKYGSNDKYMVLTEPKQIIINSGTVNLSGDGAMNAFTGGGDPSLACSPSVAKINSPVIRSGVGESSEEEYKCSGGGTDCYDTPIGVRWLSGSSTNITKEQKTPWSTERVDGISTDAPSCDIFTDVGINSLNNCLSLSEDSCRKLSSECSWETSADGGSLCKKTAGVMSEARFTVNENGSVNSCLDVKNKSDCDANDLCSWSSVTETCSRSFKLGEAGFIVNDPLSIDNSKEQTFYRGGRWVQVGVERENINTVNNPTTIDCNIYLDSNLGKDTCNGNVKLYYQVIEGTNYSVVGENGENGGHAGTAYVITTHKPDNISLLSDPGKGGKKTAITGNDGTSSSGGVCYKRKTIISNLCGTKNQDECKAASTIGCAWTSNNRCESYDFFDPEITIIKSKKTNVNMIEGSDGKNGQGSDDSVIGWGVMPGAINFMIEEVKKEAQKNNK